MYFNHYCSKHLKLVNFGAGGVLGWLNPSFLGLSVRKSIISSANNLFNENTQPTPQPPVPAGSSTAGLAAALSARPKGRAAGTRRDNCRAANIVHWF